MECAVGALIFRGLSSPLARGVPAGRGVGIALCSLRVALYFYVLARGIFCGKISPKRRKHNEEIYSFCRHGGDFGGLHHH